MLLSRLVLRRDLEFDWIISSLLPFYLLCLQGNQTESRKNDVLKDLRIIICLGNSQVTVERISVCSVIEKLMKFGIHCCHSPRQMT